jgi:hypothetical protein
MEIKKFIEYVLNTGKNVFFLDFDSFFNIFVTAKTEIVPGLPLIFPSPGLVWSSFNRDSRIFWSSLSNSSHFKDCVTYRLTWFWVLV